MTYSAHQLNTPPAEAAIEAVAADVAPELGVCAPAASLVEVVPALAEHIHHDFDVFGDATLGQFLSFVGDSGDGATSVLLGDALEAFAQQSNGEQAVCDGHIETDEEFAVSLRRAMNWISANSHEFISALGLTPREYPPAFLTERQRMSAAAAHAYEMQTGGTHD